MSEMINARKGIEPQQEVRDHVPYKSSLGMIDRWLMGREGKSTEKVIETKMITNKNYKEIKIGEKVTLSSPLWRTYTILIALVDVNTRNIKRGKKKEIAENYFGMTERAFQEHINTLYEIGLLEFENKKVKGGKTLTDIYVYNFPLYSDTQACYLEKCRNVDERSGEGMEKAIELNEARMKKRSENKNSLESENKNSLESENKNSLESENKNSHSKVIINQSNNNQSNNVQSQYSINQSIENNQNTRQEKNEGQDGQTDNNLAYQLNYENQNILPESLHQYVIDHEEELKTINVTIKHVQNFYLKYKDTIDDDVMLDALKKIIDRQERIGRFNIYFYKACQYVIEDRNSKTQRTEYTGKTKHVKTDNLPKWLRAEQGDEIAQKQINKKDGQGQNDDMEAKKREFEELMEMRKSIRKQQKGRA